MTMKYHYRTITSYRVLPPKWKILGEEKDDRSPTDQYLSRIDKSLLQTKAHLPCGSGSDIASLVFANQLMTHEVASRQMASVIQERRGLAERHLRDVQWRLDQLLERKPLRMRRPGFYDDHSLTEVERQILNLEWQKRALELALWKDTQELRLHLVQERNERETARRRFGYLTGGAYGGV